MVVLQRFYTYLAVFFGLMTIICALRVLTCGGGHIWYVPLVLAGCTAVMAVTAVRMRRKNKEEEL